MSNSSSRREAGPMKLLFDILELFQFCLLYALKEEADQDYFEVGSSSAGLMDSPNFDRTLRPEIVIRPMTVLVGFASEPPVEGLGCVSLFFEESGRIARAWLAAGEAIRGNGREESTAWLVADGKELHGKGPSMEALILASISS